MASPTALTVVVDLEEYSRFERERDVVTATITPAGSPLAGEQITVQLIKARRNRDVVVATKTITLTNDDPFAVRFDLTEILDEDACPKVRRGKYFIRATSVSDPNIVGESPDFRVTLVTTKRLIDDYLHGAELKASDTLDVREQPSVITGVTVSEVSRAHPQSFFPLAYNYSVEGGLVTRLLSWCGGPAVKVTSTKTTYLLRRSNTNDFIEVRVPDINQLPTETLSEELLIVRKPLDESRIQQIVDQAISWLEDLELHVFLEPTQICTELDPNTIAFPVDSDIPEFILADCDCQVDALTYYRPTAGHWISIRFPYFPLIRIDELYGKVSNTRVLDVALEWIEIHHRGGFVELVPFNQEVAFNFIGLVWVESLRGPVPIPNFWNFTAKVGFCKTPEILIEMIAKKAAIDLLTIAGQAFRGGVSSTSVSREGVSESVSYTASAVYGVYSASIETYQKDLKEMLKRARASFKGLTLFVL